MFDIHIKRIHEYKRQYMNLLSIIWRYKQLKKMTPAERKNAVPRVCIIGGKVGVEVWWVSACVCFGVGARKQRQAVCTNSWAAPHLPHRPRPHTTWPSASSA